MNSSWVVIFALSGCVVAIFLSYHLKWDISGMWTTNFGSHENEEQYNFKCEWFDPISRTVYKFMLNYFPSDNSVQMFDLQTNKMFLRRIQSAELEERDLYLGNTVVIYYRLLKITDYGDDFTRDEIDRKRQRTFAMVKPDAVQRLGDIVQVIERNKFEISKMKMVVLSRLQAMEFYEEHRGRPFYEDLVAYVTSGPVVAMELISSDAVKNWRDTLGPTDSNLARSEAPLSVRAKFGADKQENAAHGSDSQSSAARELDFFFSSQISSNILGACRMEKNTCCVIKPHAVRAGNLGQILSAIVEGGFEISALEMFRLQKLQAEEFLQVYDGVLPYYQQMVQQFISGPLLALEIVGKEDSSIPESFRDFVGPMDSEVAKELNPGSLRGRFGVDKVKNAVHCSDLPEDGELEVEYFFKILQNST